MYLLFDIGGTHTRIALSIDNNTLSDFITFLTPQSFDEAMRQLKQTIAPLILDKTITSAAGGVPGALNHDKSVLEKAPHLPDWVGKPLKESLEQIISSPVLLENDASLAGLGEAVFGSGTESKIVAYLTISTGVGGVRIVNKQIDLNSMGFEPGHQIVDGQKDLESYISGSGLVQKYHQKAEDITDPAIWQEVIHWTAVGLYNTTEYWSPDLIVIGGSIGLILPLDQITTELAKIMPANLPQITHATLGDQSGLFGALAYLQSISKS